MFSPLRKLFLTVIEMNKKYELFKKYKKLKPIVLQMGDLFSKSGVEFCLLYGSFARLAADKYSDIDILIVGKLKKMNEKDFLKYSAL